MACVIKDGLNKLMTLIRAEQDDFNNSKAGDTCTVVNLVSQSCDVCPLKWKIPNFYELKPRLCDASKLRKMLKFILSYSSPKRRWFEKLIMLSSSFWLIYYI